VDISVSEVIRLEHILNELLDFAKPLQLNMKYCNICELLNTYIDLLDMKFREKEIQVVTQFDDDNPDIWIDKDKIGQAIINILINAIESSGPFSKVMVKYSLESKGTTGFAQIGIEDEGIGFDEKNSTEMFKPFFTTKTKGVGLGLANVKRIIEAHNGCVFINKRESQGATFSLMIPTKLRE
jgi:signal transduction histidine kinase